MGRGLRRAEERDGTGSSAGVNFCDHTLLVGINGEHFALFFAGHIDFSVARIYPYAFGLLGDFYLPAGLA